MKRQLIMTIVISMSTIISTRAQTLQKYHSVFNKAQFANFYCIEENPQDAIKKELSGKLKGVVSKISEKKDSLFVDFWWINPDNDSKKGSAAYINSNDNGCSFVAPIEWKAGKRFFDLPFKARSFVAVNIPFRFRMKPKADLDADFLNAGVSHVWIWGKERYYKSKFVDNRQRYFAFGPFVSLSSQKIDKDNTNGVVTIEKQVGVVSYGFNGIFSVYGFNFVLALGCDNAFGYNGKHWEENNFKNGIKPWIGFGFGFSMFDISFGGKNSNK